MGLPRVDIDAPWCSLGLADEPLDRRPWVIMDTETTGLNVRTDGLREFAACVMDRGCRRIQASYEWKAADGTGALESIVKRLESTLSRGVLVAHNLDFDIAFLRRHEATRGSLAAEPKRWLCTMKASGGFISLDTLAARCRVVLTERHTAAGDTRGLAEIMVELCAAARAQGAESIGGIQAVATLRCESDAGQSRASSDPWVSITGSLPRIAPVPFPTPEQRSVVAAVDGWLEASAADSAQASLSQASKALLAAQVSAISLEIMLADSGRRQSDT